MCVYLALTLIRLMPADEQKSGSTDIDVEELVVEGEISDKRLGELAKREWLYAVFGMILGAVLILAGIVLTALGVSASVDVTFQHGSTGGRVVTGAVGVVAIAIGGAIVYFTRLQIKLLGQKK